MPITSETTFEISTKGKVAADVIERAKDRIGRAASHLHDPVNHIDLRIVIEDNHPTLDHARAEATLEIKGGPIRATDSAPSLTEAVDEMVDRLRRRIDRHEARHHSGTNRRGGGGVPDDERGNIAIAQRRPAPRLDMAADVVRRKSFAPEPMTIEVAAFDLDVLDHDFYLFQELHSGEVALLSRTDSERLKLEIPASADIADSPVAPFDRVDGPIVLDLMGAQRVLATSSDSYVFHRPNEGAPGQVLYRRFDGDFGLLELANV